MRDRFVYAFGRRTDRGGRYYPLSGGWAQAKREVHVGFLRRPTESRPGATGDDFHAMIDRLRRAGVDPAVPHVTRHFMYVPGVKAAQRLARELKAAGRSVDVETSARRGFWLVIVSQSMILTKEQMSSVRAEFEAAARSVGGEYDRWQVDLAGS
jgi:hypothetical protein